MGLSPRIVIEDVMFLWDGVTQRLPKGQVIDVAPGSPLERAIGAHRLIPHGLPVAVPEQAVPEAAGMSAEQTAETAAGAVAEAAAEAVPGAVAHAIGGGGGGGYAGAPPEPGAAVEKPGSDDRDGDT